MHSVQRDALDPDLACIDRSLRARDGSVAAAVVAGQLFCKRYRAQPNFDNSERPAFVVDEFGEVETRGVLRFSIRWHLAPSVFDETAGAAQGRLDRRRASHRAHRGR